MKIVQNEWSNLKVYEGGRNLVLKPSGLIDLYLLAVTENL